MSAEFFNVYEDQSRADAYAKLKFPGTYFLAYRDLRSIFAEHLHGRSALDFGCGTGRSTRFLHELGFEVTGVDISEAMVAQARKQDPHGDYRLVAEGDFSGLKKNAYDLVFCSFTFDNVPTMGQKTVLFRGLRPLLSTSGRIITLVSTPDIYVHEWASFSTKDFPENRSARSGEKVRIVILDVEDRRPVEDILCTDADYQEIYRRAKLKPLATYRPLGKVTEQQPWVTEMRIAPWAIYVLAAH